LADFGGDVQIFVPGEVKPLPPEKGMPLEEGDRIVTGADSNADVSIDGGSLIRLSALSDFTLADDKRSQSEFKLTLGTFLAKIKKLAASQSMVVQTPTAVAQVRGTEFGVQIDAASPDDTHVGVFDEGKVEVKGQTGGPETIIAGQETKVTKGQAPLHGYQLERFVKYRSYMRAAMKTKLQNQRRTWKSMSPASRKALREKTLARMRQHRQDLLKNSSDLQQQNEKKKKKKKSADAESDRKKKKMEDFRDQIRRKQGQ
jgi:hypothetical protein